MIAWFKSFLDAHTSSKASMIECSEPIVLIVSHGAYMTTFLSVLLSPIFLFALAPDVDRTRSCANTSIMRVRCMEKSGKWEGVIESWAEVGHLKELLKKDLEIADDIR